MLYDRDCGFCKWGVARLLDWDRGGRLRTAAIQSEIGDQVLAGMEPDRRLESWHFLAPDGRLLSGGAAIPPLMRELPGGAPFAVLAALFPPATDWAYRKLARYRRFPGRLLPQRAKRRATQRLEESERLSARTPDARAPTG